MRHLEAVIEIDASPPAVWAVLTDFDRYPDWNPFIESIAGRCEVGARLQVTMTPPDSRPMTLRPVVLAADPVHGLRWLGRLIVPRLFDGEHSFLVEPLGAGRTRFTQSETFRGLLVPFTGRVLAKVADGFGLMNRALAEEVARRGDQAGGIQPASWMSSATTGSTSSSTWRNSNPARSA